MALDLYMRIFTGRLKARSLIFVKTNERTLRFKIYICLMSL